MPDEKLCISCGGRRTSRRCCVLTGLKGRETLLRDSVNASCGWQTLHSEGPYQISRQIAVPSITRATLALVGRSLSIDQARGSGVVQASVLCSGAQGQRRLEWCLRLMLATGCKASIPATSLTTRSRVLSNVQYTVIIMKDVRSRFALTRIVDLFDWRYRSIPPRCMNKGRHGRKDDDDFSAS